jgi:hypothetical protein
VPAPSQDNAPRKTTLSELEDTYKKVSLAQSLLKGGETSKAKSLLDAIPTSPSGLLKNVTGRGQ